MHTILSSRVIAPALVVALCAASAVAQDAPDPRTTARAHLGPFYLTPRVTLEEFGVDTNVFSNAEEQRDFTVTLAPHVDIWVPFTSRARVTTSVTTDLVYYHTFASERSINPDVRVRGELLLNRLTVFAEPSYLRSRQRLNYEIDARAARKEGGLGIGADLRLTPKLSLGLAARRSNLRFDADAVFDGTLLQETLNRRTRTASIALRHALTPYTTIELRSEREAQRFDLSPVRDAGSISVLPGVEFNSRALISGAGSVGYRAFRPLGDELPEFSGLVARVALGYTLLGSTRLTFTADRDVYYSYLQAQPYFIASGYGLTIRRQLSRRFDITAGGERHTYTYEDLVALGQELPGSGVDASQTGRVDTTRVWFGGTGYTVGTSMRLGTGVAYRARDSNRSHLRNYSGFRFLATVDLGL